MSKRDGTCVQVVLLGVFSVLGRWVVAGALQQLIAVRAAIVGSTSTTPVPTRARSSPDTEA